jgi:hypothetical protein
MEHAGVKKRADDRNKTDPNYAFGHYVNDACVKRGEEMVKEVIKEREKRAEDVKKEIGQQAKEAATYFAAKARGRVTLTGTARYNCFKCQYNAKSIKDEHGRSLCGFLCNNGEYFNPIEEASDDKEHKQ